MSIGSKIKELRRNKGMTQKELAKKINKSPQVISNWERGYTPNVTNDDILNLANVLSAKVSDIIGENISISNQANPSAPKEEQAYKKQIPILGSVVAGNPQYAYQDIEGYIEIDTRYAPYKTGDYFALTVKGSSMSPRMEEGDIIIVKIQDYIRAGEVAVVLIGDEATVKEVREAPDGNGICLVGANVAVYKPHLYSRNDIESQSMRICGKVVEMRRRF